jgi:hypothetical protein
MMSNHLPLSPPLFVLHLFHWWLFRLSRMSVAHLLSRISIICHEPATYHQGNQT